MDQPIMTATPFVTDQTALNYKSNGMVVYFDGICGFCNGTVNFLLKHDPQGKLTYAPLQGETARERLDPAEVTDLNTLIVTINDRKYHRSAAVVRILWQLGGIWNVLGSILWVIPQPIRDAGYRLVAKFRYRIFGKHESCRLPSPEERDRFLP